MKRLRRWVIAGLLVWLPVAVTFLLLRFIIGLMDGTLALLPAEWQPEALFGFEVPGLGLVLTIAVLLLTGMFAANFVGRTLVGLWESLLRRIPIVRSIYGASKNFTEVVFSDTGESFKRVLLIEYPGPRIYSLAFQTATSLGEVQEKTGDEVICAFVPTTPNPTSGYIVAIPKDAAIELDMTVDEALKMIISLGVVVPEWRGSRPTELMVDGRRVAVPPDGA